MTLKPSSAYEVSPGMASRIFQGAIAHGMSPERAGALNSPAKLAGLNDSAVEEEVSGAMCLFCEVVPVRVKLAARDEFTASLTVRLKPYNGSHPRSLQLELTDESDLFFYHSLLLGEGDFHALKAEQRLLVDFQSFPAKLVELLGHCMEAAKGLTSSAKMIATLDCSPGGESLLSIVESNHFRELTHLALRLRQGSDEAVKQHLAGKLRGLRAEKLDLTERLTAMEDTYDQSKKQVEDLTARARIVAEERLHLERSLTQAHQRELAELKEERSRCLLEQTQQASEQRARLEAEMQQALTQVHQRLAAAEARNEDLQQQLQVQTSSGKTCRERLSVAETQLLDATSEGRALREQVKQLELEKFQHERELTELRVGKSSLQDQLASKEQLAENQATLHEQAASQRRSLEEELVTCKQQVKILEDKFAQAAEEIAKGNQIIQTLRTSLKQTKAKVRLKSTALNQQEKAMFELERSEDATKHAVEEKAGELARAHEREEQLKREADELRAQLAEAQGVVKTNKEVIEYLNAELTKRDLRGMPSSGMLLNGTSSSLASKAALHSRLPLSATSLDALRKFESLGSSERGGTPNLSAPVPLASKAVLPGGAGWMAQSMQTPLSGIGIEGLTKVAAAPASPATVTGGGVLAAQGLIGQKAAPGAASAIAITDWLKA